MNTKRFAPMIMLLALAYWPVAPASAQSNQQVLSAARNEQAGVIQSLHDMVSIESGSDDQVGLEAMCRYTENRLQAMGAVTQRIATADGKSTHLVKGVFSGNGTLRVMLIGHMDTVYRKGILRDQPYRRVDNKLYGPGIADDKGGIAVILHSLAILNKLGWKNYKQLTVLLDPDEEIGSPDSGHIIQTLGSENEVVLSFEPNPAKEIAKSESVLLKAAGTGRVLLDVSGRAAHAGAAPEQGRNALLEMAYQLTQTQNTAQSVTGAQLNWTLASAGEAPNQIPAHAQAEGDVRVSEFGAGEALAAALVAKVKEQHLIADTSDEITYKPGRPIYEAGARGMRLANLAQSVYGELSEGNLDEVTSERPMPSPNNPRNLLLIPGTLGGTDAGFAGASGKPAVLESLGLSGWGYHARDEYIEIDSIVPRLYLTTRLLMELGKQTDTNH